MPTLAAAIDSGTLPALEQLSLEDIPASAAAKVRGSRGRPPSRAGGSQQELRATVQEAARSEPLSELNASELRCMGHF